MPDSDRCTLPAPRCSCGEVVRLQSRRNAGTTRQSSRRTGVGERIATVGTMASMPFSLPEWYRTRRRAQIWPMSLPLSDLYGLQRGGPAGTGVRGTSTRPRGPPPVPPCSRPALGGRRRHHGRAGSPQRARDSCWLKARTSARCRDVRSLPIIGPASARAEVADLSVVVLTRERRTPQRIRRREPTAALGLVTRAPQPGRRGCRPVSPPSRTNARPLRHGQIGRPSKCRKTNWGSCSPHARVRAAQWRRFCVLDFRARREPVRLPAVLPRPSTTTTPSRRGHGGPRRPVGGRRRHGRRTQTSVLHESRSSDDPLRRRSAVTAPLWFAMYGDAMYVAAGYDVARKLRDDPDPVVRKAAVIYDKHAGRDNAAELDCNNGPPCPPCRPSPRTLREVERSPSGSATVKSRDG